jgi:hypothetical protein
MEKVKIYSLFGGDAARQRAESKAKALRDSGLFAGVATVDEVDWDDKPLYPTVGDTSVAATHVVYGPIA